MDTRFLETFLMAVDNGSIAEAARRLNLTAAAVAKRIRALESEIGAVLVTRSGRTIRPTEAGAAIVERARRFLIESGVSSELYRKVLDGDDLDAAIIGQPPFVIPKSCNWRLLREEPLILLTRAPAASRKPRVILSSEPFIRLDRNVWPGRLVDGYLRKTGIRPRELFEIDGGAVIAIMVDRGLGVSILPDLAPPWPEGLSLVKLPLPDAAPFARRIGVVWARASLRLRLVEAFLEQAEVVRARGPVRKPVNSGARVR